MTNEVQAFSVAWEIPTKRPVALAWVPDTLSKRPLTAGAFLRRRGYYKGFARRLRGCRVIAISF